MSALENLGALLPAHEDECIWHESKEVWPNAPFDLRIDALCLAALHLELMAWPKPGLVTPVDAGSHSDMDVRTFLSSIAALRGSFAAMARAGAANAELHELQAIGLDAEARMLDATLGVNTHRGAIFNLGLLSAAAGLRRVTPALARVSLGRIVARRWGDAIVAARTRAAPRSHGDIVHLRHAVGGARAEAAAGFPAVYEVAVPMLRDLQRQGIDGGRGMVGVLLALMAHVEDSNLVWRGGVEGLQFVRKCARMFNAAGGVRQDDWRERLLRLHRRLVARHLSPGGSADLAAVAVVAHTLDAESPSASSCAW